MSWLWVIHVSFKLRSATQVSSWKMFNECSAIELLSYSPCIDYSNRGAKKLEPLNTVVSALWYLLNQSLWFNSLVETVFLADTVSQGKQVQKMTIANVAVCGHDMWLIIKIFIWILSSFRSPTEKATNLEMIFSRVFGNDHLESRVLILFFARQFN